MSKNKLPQEVIDYIAIMHKILNEDAQTKNDIFGNEYVDEKTFWQLFENQSMINWAKNGDPVLTPEEFKDVQMKTVKLGLEESFAKLVELGLVSESEEGFQITDEGIEAYKRANEEK